MKFLCSSGAFVGKVNGWNHELIPSVFPRLASFDGLEFMLENTWYETIDEKVAYLKENLEPGKLVTVHFDKDIGDDVGKGDMETAVYKLTSNCRAAEALGIKKGVLHLWSGHSSDNNFRINLEAYPRLFEIAAKHGILLTVEDIPCVVSDPITHWLELREKYPDISFTADTRFLAFHGVFDAFYKSDLVKNVKHIHISDWNAPLKAFDRLRPIIQPGEGKIDFATFFDYMVKHGYNETVTLESPGMFDWGTDTDMLNASGDKLRKWVSDADK